MTEKEGEKERRWKRKRDGEKVGWGEEEKRKEIQEKKNTLTKKQYKRER